jgi:hypothetical protein
LIGTLVVSPIPGQSGHQAFWRRRLGAFVAAVNIAFFAKTATIGIAGKVECSALAMAVEK